MKKILILLLALPCLALAQNPMDNMFGSASTYKDVKTFVIHLGSSAKTAVNKKNNRALIPITLPQGTEEWYYRITILKKDAQRDGFKKDETYYYYLSNNQKAPLISPIQSGIDFYVLSSKKQTDIFMKHFKQKFDYDKNCFYKNVQSFTGSCKTTAAPLWIGLRNPNPARSLKVIVEIVAYGKF